MDAWTLFWVLLAVLTVYWFRYWILVFAAAAFTFLVGAAVWGIAALFSAIESFNDWRHRKKYKL